MKTLIILATLITIPALAEVEFTLIPDRIEMDVTETVTITNTGEETATAARKERAEADQAKSRIAGEKHRPETNPVKQTKGGITAEDDWMSPVRGQSPSPSIRNTKGKVDKEVVDGKTNRKTAEDMNSSRSNRRGSHNTSRSNTSRPRRLDTDDDGDGISDMRRCNAKDNDCDDRKENSTK